MITSLAPLGKDNTVHIIADYQGDNVTLTISAIPRNEKLQDKATQTLQIAGTIAEVQEQLPRIIAEGVPAMTNFQSTLAALKEENDKALAEERSSKAKKPAEKKSEPAKGKGTVPKIEPASSITPSAVPATGDLNLADMLEEATAKK
ncbi:MAG: hypothetical protein NVV63_12515 [Opitutus sp.]|nr:hypothetical protein [Opitutus sp.]